MVGRYGWGQVDAAGAAIRGVFAGAVLAVAAVASPVDLDAQRWKTVTAARQVTDEEGLRVKVDYGAGVLTVRRGDDGELYNALFHFDENWAIPKTHYANGRLEVGLSTSESRNPNHSDWPDEASLELALAAGVPMDLELNFGAGQAELDLTGLGVRKLVVNTGASESVIRVGEANRERMESAAINVGAADLDVLGVGNLNAEQVTVKSGLGSVTLRLDGEWEQDGYLVVSMGLGALELQIPRSLGVRLRRPDSFLASIETEGLEKRGKVYQSANWESAERKVEIEITAVLGSVDLEWIR